MKNKTMKQFPPHNYICMQSRALIKRILQIGKAVFWVLAVSIFGGNNSLHANTAAILYQLCMTIGKEGGR